MSGAIRKHCSASPKTTRQPTIPTREPARPYPTAVRPLAAQDRGVEPVSAQNEPVCVSRRQKFRILKNRLRRLTPEISPKARKDRSLEVRKPKKCTQKPRKCGLLCADSKCHEIFGLCGWGGRIRTSAWRNQNPLPYRLATPQRALRGLNQPAGGRTIMVHGGARNLSSPFAREVKSVPGKLAKPLARRRSRGYKAHTRSAGPPRQCRSVAQPGSAPRSGRGGRRFESSHSDHFFLSGQSLTNPAHGLAG